MPLYLKGRFYANLVIKYLMECFYATDISVTRVTVLALRDQDIQAIGCYGKMKELEKREAYFKWKNGEIQVIVATRAFGLGINKPDVRFVIRNGLPPSISAWAQEFGRAGRDGKQSYAYILFSDNDIQHVGFWARDMARQHRSTDIDDSAHQ